MMNSRERRLFSWSNATCAMPLREALSSRRGRGRALGRRLQESRARRATRLYPRRRRRYRRWSAVPSTTQTPRWMSPSRAYTNVGADIRRFAVTGRLPPFAPGDGPQSRQPDCISNETKEVSMKNMNRRSALTLSLAATSAVVVTKSATAQPYAPTQGTEIAPGVRQVDLTKRESMISSYKTISMRDVVYQPKAKSDRKS